MSFSSDHEASLFVRAVHFVDGVNEARISEGEVLLNGKLPVVFDSLAHDFFKTGVDDIDLAGTLEVRIGFESHDFEELLLGSLFVLLGHLAWGDVIQVLEPLEVRAGDTTTVDQHVWGSNDSSPEEDLLGLVGSWAIGTFEDSLHLDLLSVHGVEGLLCGSWDEAVGLLFEEEGWVVFLGFFGMWVADKSAILCHEVFDILNVKTIWVVDS